jgi:hypothetical protein
MTKLRMLLAGLLCFTLFGQAAAVPAGPALPASNNGFTLTQYRDYDRDGYRRYRYDRYERRYRRRDRGVGAAIGLGIVGALIAGGIAESDARERSSRCARTFRSYNPETGTYIASGGYERRCPYL